MTNYCNAWKNKWLSTKAQQVFLTLAHKLLSTQEDYQLRNFIFTIIHPGKFKVINLTIIKSGALYWDPLCYWLCSQFDRTQRRKVNQTYTQYDNRC